MKRAEELYVAAKISVGRKIGTRMARMEISILLDDYQRKVEQHDEFLEVIETLCLEIPEVEKILKIKRVGLVSVAGFFAKVGDIRHFKSPKQITVNLVPVDNASGCEK